MRDHTLLGDIKGLNQTGSEAYGQKPAVKQLSFLEASKKDLKRKKITNGE
jgi:hypothetical protein